MMTDQSFSVVIPVYNSENTLAELTDRISATFSNIPGEYEIILIDDCSEDTAGRFWREFIRKTGM